MEIKGIDVSSYQSKPDWAKVSNSEIKFAILRIHQNLEPIPLLSITTKDASQMESLSADINTVTL